jgi:mannose-6-phosphate isomerase-like protein (cupin superfamily)
LLSLGAKASYPLYTRLSAEALVLLEGEVAVDIEDRRYRFGLLDAIAVPGQLPRRVVNLSSNRPAVIHVAIASASPDQRWVNGRFTPVEQPLTTTGQVGGEQMHRNDSTAQTEPLPRAQFQRLFSALPGAPGICGCYGEFEPGARLPCHRHEFDASIMVVEGTATCIVEGRRYELSSNATALVPQGRCHYLINLTLEPTTMIWIYAGDRPDRIVMDELLCHPEKAQGHRGSAGQPSANVRKQA